MKGKKAVSVLVSVVCAVIGILLIYSFVSMARSIIELVLGCGFAFLSVFNLYLTVKYSKNKTSKLQ
ncbi:hypothetical protein Cst_c01650 [Thermoclostridium stercorarium subsp. stercorarium DSM 8532]|jgi:predicted RND superfamily exporter protein|uniref:Uncharacterized protein n=3 Tax=Thermoclostridium stercorarium TaxID=1510 RepID=L7VL52_THES1|nr:hypothetical protein [Thermoclostridium stercorarium]AGC67191.1 hypothetical protein Cst_c01650 [Thermoclostridium stercorarium subsp. stercorarium DSM 8532]AGI38269.1 hypothetical protein Clst_0158 [Thermoclostridium stercorarium subsp. stercorarium DSM 8532]ANW97662.1 hypothetical protein CSTERTH_00755 [Thermoclostridium stercorarium subsp. thermolacticum DSM 2910]ANX00224.1 hypothetical protein CSTERLE_00755 [Thermoclostridium stercorarium subsp. leptospartum DSM 9219]UZQ85783.1 hypothet